MLCQGLQIESVGRIGRIGWIAKRGIIQGYDSNTGTLYFWHLVTSALALLNVNIYGPILGGAASIRATNTTGLDSTHCRTSHPNHVATPINQ